MARRSGFWIRPLFGNRSKPSDDHLFDSMPSLPLCYARWRTKSSPIACKLPLSSPNLHFVERSDSGLLFSSPPNMVIISNKDDYNRAIQEVKDGLLPAVFYFIDRRRSPMYSVVYHTLYRLRGDFPHVTIYKVISIPVVGMEEMLKEMPVDSWPKFHCYLNGEMAFEIHERTDLKDVFAMLYRNVVPIETTQPTGSSGKGKRRAKQLVIQAKKDENDKGSVRALSQWRGSATLSQLRGDSTLAQGSGGLVDAVERSTAPSLDEVMQVVESLPGGHVDSILWWFARGLFKYQPKKRMMFSEVKDSHFKVAWLLHEMAAE